MSLSMGLYFEVTRYHEGADDYYFRNDTKTMSFDCAELARQWAYDAIDEGYTVEFGSKSSTPWNEIDDPLQCPVCAGYGQPCNETTEEWLEDQGLVWYDELGHYDEPGLESASA